MLPGNVSISEAASFTQFKLHWCMANDHPVKFKSQFWWTTDYPLTRGLNFVKDLINQNTNTWNVIILQMLYPQEVVQHIMRTPISCFGVSDELIWIDNASALYSVRLAYQALMDQDKSNRDLLV